MTGKYSNAFPDPSEPNAFPFLEGYYYGFTFSVFITEVLRFISKWNLWMVWISYITWYWIDPLNLKALCFIINSINPF